MPKFVLLWTDVTVWLLVLATVAYIVMVARKPNLSANWRKVFANAPALASSVVLVLCMTVTVLDSVHFRSALPPAAGTTTTEVAYDTRTRSVLDALLVGLIDSREATYSRPLDYLGFTKESATVNGEVVRTAPRLVHGGAHLKDPAAEWAGDVTRKALIGLLGALVFLAVATGVTVAAVARHRRVTFGTAASAVWHGEGPYQWRAVLWMLAAIAALAGPALVLMADYHVLGTDLTGNDVLYQSLKSIRTAFVIGALATVATLPLAVVLGIMAGYFRHRGHAAAGGSSRP